MPIDRPSALLLVSLLSVVACTSDSARNAANASNPSGSSVVSLQVIPSSAALSAQQSVHFTAAIEGTDDKRITWQVVEKNGGSVDANGDYHAPSSPGVYHVVANSVAHPGVVANASVAVDPSATAPAPAALPVISSFSALPASITAGDAATLSWVVSGASGVSINQGVGAVSDASIAVSPAATTTYTLTAFSAAGSVSATTTVTLAPAPVAAAPVVTSFSASPASISAGQPSTLSWAVSGTVTSITIDPLGSVTGDHVSVNPATTTEYTLRATGPGGSTSAQTTVTVAPVAPAPTVGGISPQSGPVGTTVTISGTDLTGASAVTFAGTRATFTVQSAAAISAIVPAGAASGAIAVTTPAGTAQSSTFTVATATVTPAPTVTAPTPAPAGGTPRFGTAHSPNNRTIADWAPGIRSRYGLSSGADVLDAAATADLQAAFNDGSGRFGAPYVAFKQDSYALYYAADGDPELPVYKPDGTTLKSCPLDAGKGWTGVRIPAGAKIFASGSAQRIDTGLVTADDDFHFTVIDVARNRVYSFYTYSGASFGVSGGRLITSGYSGCDTLFGDDAAIAAASGDGQRYACSGGASYPGAGCGMAGVGAGISAGGSFGNGDSNGFMGPHGVIDPRDFDDTGWTGAAVGTLHHALRCSMPNAYQYGYVWPTSDPMAGTPGRSMKNGQIIRLDPTYDVAGSGADAPTKRIMRTLQVYGCVVSDYASWGLELFAQSAWDGTGPSRGVNPWTGAGGANSEAQAFYAGASSSTGLKTGLSVPTSRLQMVLPHGAAH